MANKDIDTTLITVGQPSEGGCCWTVSYTHLRAHET